MPSEVLKTAVARAPSGDVAPPAARVFTDTEDHVLVQRRLGLLYGLLGAIVTGFWVLGLVVVMLLVPGRALELHLSAPKLLHALTGIFLLCGWALSRGKPRPRWMLSLVDLGAGWKTMALVSFAVGLSPPELRVGYLALVAFVLFVMLRAAVVPSPPRWTALVATLAAVPIPFGVRAGVGATSDAFTSPSAVLAMSAAWCLVGVVAAYTVSNVVYGLRSEVKSAMRLGQYTLEEKIGEGGMGIVHRARHALLRRPVAIKLLPRDRTGEGNVRRFEREVQLTASLTHPNTIAIYDFGHTRDGVFYYVMELLDGVSLEELVEREGPQPAARVVHVLAQLVSALAEAHAVGLVHRDVKPANVYLTERGGIPDFVKVLDFGLVKDTEHADAALSTTNAITGTPLYMAPESITRPDAVDARVDIYAVGGVAYWLLTGQPTFEGANLVEICSHHLHTAPTPPSERLGRPLPPGVDAMVLRCLAKSPADRFGTAGELLAALRALAADLPWNPEPSRPRTTDRPAARTPSGAKRAAQDAASSAG